MRGKIPKRMKTLDEMIFEQRKRDQYFKTRDKRVETVKSLINDEGKLTVSKSDLADYLGISRQWLIKWMKRNGFGGLVEVEPSQLKSAREENTRHKWSEKKKRKSEIDTLFENY